MQLQRRGFLASAGAYAVGAAIVRAQSHSSSQMLPQSPPPSPSRAQSHPASVGEAGVAVFPTTDPSLAMEAVRRAHFPDSGPLAELLADDRSLALAAWDWGFGDWETALGAASHMGRRDTAEMLMSHGARPDLFTLAMLDRVAAVRAVCTAIPGVQRIRGPHGITLLQHARNGEASRVVEYLETLGDADVGQQALPIDPAMHDVYAGAYAAAELNGDRLLVEPAKSGGLTLKRAGLTPRSLNRVGEREFNPVGAPHVVLRFTVADGKAVRLLIDRGRTILSADRVS